MSTAYIWKDRTKVSLILKQKRKKVDEKKKKAKIVSKIRQHMLFSLGLKRRQSEGSDLFDVVISTAS